MGASSPEGEADDYATVWPDAAGARPRRLQTLRLPDQGLGVADLELARRLDVESLDDAVFHQHRIALRANAHAARGQVERQAGRLGEVGAAVGHHADLAGRLLVARPGAHDERIVDRNAPDLVNAGRLQRGGLFDVARDVLGRA